MSTCDPVLTSPESGLRHRLVGHAASRKWTAAVLGTGCVMFVYATALTAVLFAPAEKAQTIVSIGNMAVVFLGAICGSLVTGQSFVDWRHGSESQFIGQDRRSESNISLTQNTTQRVFAPKHFDDETIS